MVGVGIGKYPPENGNVSKIKQLLETVKNQIFKMDTEIYITQTSPRACLHHKLHGPKDGHSKGLDGTGVPVENESYRLINWECDKPDDPTILFQVVALSPLIPLRHLGRGDSNRDSRESSSLVKVILA